MAASIKDIARHLNLSVSTVSYALNGGPRPVREEIRQRVLAAAQEMAYRPNRIAKSMVTGKSDTIGVVPPEAGNDAFLGPHLQLALNGISNEAGRLHKDVLLFTRYRETEHQAMLSVILDGRVDGVIFVAPYFTAKTVELATALHLPSATISGAPVQGVLSFSIDNDHGMAQILDHLYGLGHRKIAHIAGRLDMEDAIVRLQGYQTFLHEKRLPYNDEYVAKGQFLIDGGRKAMAELMNLPIRPTAVTCANDEMAIGALQCAHDLGMKVPGDVSITGFDMTSSSAHIYPPLTTVRNPIGDVAEAAVRAVNCLIEGKTPMESTVFQTDLVVRASTAPPCVHAHSEV